MSDTVILSIISLVGTIATTVGIGVVAYFQHGQKRVAAATEKKVDEVHELTNSRLSRIEAALASMTRQRDALLKEHPGPKNSE